MQFKRSSGILLHPTSLPGKEGCGSLGKEAYEFIDFLAASSQKLWQIFPLGHTGFGDSPYQCFSAFSGNPLLISLEKLKEDGLLEDSDFTIKEPFDENYVDYGKIILFKYTIFKKAFESFKIKITENTKIDFDNFYQKNKGWLDNYVLFLALKEYNNGKPWYEWEHDLKFRKTESLLKYKEELSDIIEFQIFLQYIFFKQWQQLKNYANKNNIKIIGDLPIFVSYDSADAWAHPEIFFFDADLNQIKTAGVPPDYFSETGQLWGNPLYNWNKLKETNYTWWIERFKSIFSLVDIIRLDHFRGFAGYWAIPAKEKSAINGTWEKGPGKDFFNAVENRLGKLPIIAEDLGVITKDVEELRDLFNFPGMKVLQFAFDSKEENIYIPHTYSKNCVVYTGTHDNDTTIGWYQKLNIKDKEFLNEYLNTDGSDISWVFIRAAWSSVAVFAITPLQDILSLGSEARMNIPGVLGGNWRWRYKKDMLNSSIINKLKRMTKIYER